MATPVSWRGLLATGVVSFAAVSYYQVVHTEKISSSGIVKTTGKAMLGGSWSLISTKTGDFVTEKSYDVPTILYFGFAHCPDICPSELRKLSKALDQVRALQCEK